MMFTVNGVVIPSLHPYISETVELTVGIPYFDMAKSCPFVHCNVNVHTNLCVHKQAK